MKFLAAFALIAVLAISASHAASPVRVTSAPKGVSRVQLDLCPLCVQFADQALNQLLNIILNAGVIGGCSDLCSKLPNKVEATACNLLCDVVGIEVFIKAIQKADLDPIWYCEILKTCPVHDCEGPCAKIENVAIQPPSGPAGTTFDITMTFTVFNQTGTGEIVIDVESPDGPGFGDGSLNEGFAPGNYGVKFQLQAQPSEDEPFSPGTYKVDLAICEGQCGSKHPHSAVYDVKSSSFQITQ
eukprot:ANDGO_05370.mRNA.1 Countin-1